MGNNLKGVGMAVGVGMVICGLLLATLMIAQPSSLLQGEEWTLINLLDNDDGLWMDEDGDLKIDLSEGCEIGETYKSEVEIDFVAVFLGIMFMIIGIGFIVVHLGIER